jgi:hypothetical protein
MRNVPLKRIALAMRRYGIKAKEDKIEDKKILGKNK